MTIPLGIGYCSTYRTGFFYAHRIGVIVPLLYIFFKQLQRGCLYRISYVLSDESASGVLATVSAAVLVFLPLPC